MHTVNITDILPAIINIIFVFVTETAALTTNDIIGNEAIPIALVIPLILAK